MAAGLAGAVLIKRARESELETGTMTVRVYDALTGAALKNASVVVPEYDKSVKTGKNGSTGTLTLSVCRNAGLDALLPAGWGEITLLIYCEGYYPCAIFHVRVPEGGSRDGPYVYLLPDDGTLMEPYSLIEAPPQDWVSALLGKYAP